MCNYLGRIEGVGLIEKVECEARCCYFVVMNNNIILCQRKNWVGLKGLNVWRGVVVVPGRAYAAFLRNRLQDIKI